MKNLEELLNADNVRKIKRLGTMFGFSDIKIWCVPNDTILQLLAIVDPHQEDQYDTALQAKLIELLKCELILSVDQSVVNSAILNVILNNSAALEDKDEIIKLFNVTALSDVKVSDQNEDSLSQAQYRQALNFAERILKSKKDDTAPTFFGSNKVSANTSSSQPEKQEQKRHFNEIQEFTDWIEGSEFDAILQQLPSENLSKIQNTIERLKKSRGEGLAPNISPSILKSK